MDEELKELKELAALALRNAFWLDFSALVNNYLALAKGLDTDLLEMQMGEMTSVYGRDEDAKDSDLFLNLWTANTVTKDTFSNGNTSHETIVAALEFEPAYEVHLRGLKVFEKRDGEWFFTGGMR